jgi:hypothetical protein
MTIFIIKVAMCVNLLIFIFFSFVTIRSRKMSEWVWDRYVACFCGEDVASWDSWVYLSDGGLSICWRYLQCLSLQVVQAYLSL